MLTTIVELPEFIRKAEKIFTDDERNELLFYLSTHPSAGILLQGTGGIRKLRWATQGKGKSGGARVIYFFYNERSPLFLISAFSKSDKVNLSKAERNELAGMTEKLIADYKV